MMREKRARPLIYLLFGENQKGEKKIFFTNTQGRTIYQSIDFLNTLETVDELIKKTTFFDKRPVKKERDLQEILPELRMRKLFIVEILYQQKQDWQGCIYGISTCYQMPFSSKNDMKKKIELELKIYYKKHEKQFAKEVKE